MATYYELSPIGGRDYRSAKEVKSAFDAGQDFCGDYQLGFARVNKPQLKVGDTVLLRYKGLRQVASMTITTLELIPVPLGPVEVAKAKKPPSESTMMKWMMDGVAKATDGCRVEPDGTCEHGKPSWLLKLGMI